MLKHYTKIERLLEDKTDCVLVSVAHVAGSAPRDAGTHMLVSRDDQWGTIGGGNLEFEAIKIARRQLQDSSTASGHKIELFPLGPMLEQCCGGAVILCFELFSGEIETSLKQLVELESAGEAAYRISRLQKDNPTATESIIVSETKSSGHFSEDGLQSLALDKASSMLADAGCSKRIVLHSMGDGGFALPNIDEVLMFELVAPADFQIAIFGAGHVGSALVDILSTALPCQITWIDSRAQQFHGACADNVITRVVEDPVSAVESLSPASYCLVMTHSHQLDQELCQALLERSDLAFTGLIGSNSKIRRFRKRLLESGLSEAQLGRLCCPIGIQGIESKQPGAIAVSVAAQLLQLYESRSNQNLEESPQQSEMNC